MHVFIRRRSRNRFYLLFLISTSLLMISFVIHFDLLSVTDINAETIERRLFCLVISTIPIHEKFIHLNNITWAKRCYRMGHVRYTRLPSSDDDFNADQSSYYLNLWIYLLKGIRLLISPYEYISKYDILVIVPANTFVFREKIRSLISNGTNNARLPLFVIQKLEEGNAYILNGRALNLARNTKLIDSCLQQVYPGAREKYLWKCVDTTLNNKRMHSKCGNDTCHIRYYSNYLTISHIKDGSCLRNSLHLCRSIAILHPTTLSDTVTLEFFKYRLKSKFL